MDLAKFLLARIADDDRVAKASAKEPYHFYADGHYGAVAEFLERWNPVNPACVLAECEAKRRIVERCRETMADYHAGYTGQFQRPRGEVLAEALARDTLRLLALPYADHPDYREEEWKP